MSGGWYLFLFLFIFGISAQTVSTLGIWNVHYPSSDFQVTEGMITDVQNQTSHSSPTIFVIYSWVVTFVTIIGSGFVAVFSVSALLYAMGWPVGIVGGALLQVIQLPANLIILMWLFELYTGHQV